MGNINWDEYEGGGIIESFLIGCLFSLLTVGYYISKISNFFNDKKEDWE